MPAARETAPPNGARKGSRDGSNDAPVIGSAPQTRLFSGFSGTTSTQRQVPGVAGGGKSTGIEPSLGNMQFILVEIVVSLERVDMTPALSNSWGK